MESMEQGARGMGRRAESRALRTGLRLGETCQGLKDLAESVKETERLGDWENVWRSQTSRAGL